MTICLGGDIGSGLWLRMRSEHVLKMWDRTFNLYDKNKMWRRMGGGSWKLVQIFFSVPSDSIETKFQFTFCGLLASLAKSLAKTQQNGKWDWKLLAQSMKEWIPLRSNTRTHFEALSLNQPRNSQFFSLIFKVKTGLPDGFPPEFSVRSNFGSSLGVPEEDFGRRC